MIDKQRRPTFAGATDLVAHAKAAARHLEDLCAACTNGDKAAARAALQAISELELARAMLRTGLE
jgi:hypothetical protein